MTKDLRTRIDDSPMTGYQWGAVSICILLNVLDGFDVLVMAFTAQAVSEEFDISGSVLGLLLSAGLVGMAVGSMVLAPLADTIGRRGLILLCLVLASSGMLVSAVSQNATQLGLLRVLTGLGIGGILASSNVVASEYASTRWRGLAVSLNSTGYAIGATSGGLIAVILIGSFGWRSVFVFGGICTALMVPVVFLRLPESLDFLITRRPKNALERINAFAQRVGQSPLAALPPVASTDESAEGQKNRVQQLLSGDLKRQTLLVWFAFFLTMFGFYFVTSWTPKLLVEAGLTPEQGVTGGLLLNLGGIFGATLLGVLSSRFLLNKVLVGYMVLSGLLLLAFVPATQVVAVAFVIGIVIGVFVNGCIAGLYALTPIVYPAAVRATGVGWAIGIGRIGAILSPILAGLLLDAGWSATQLYAMVGVFFVAAALVVFRIREGNKPVETDAFVMSDQVKT